MRATAFEFVTWPRDGCLAMGAALMVDRNLHGDHDPPSQHIRHVSYGPSYSTNDIWAAIQASTEPRVGLEDAEGFVARLLASDKAVGWYGGPMEYGPRVLGHRSTLASPTDASINDWLNEQPRRTELMTAAFDVSITRGENASRLPCTLDGT